MDIVAELREITARLDREGRKLKVVSPQGLILLKSFRRSGTDEDDIAHLRRITDED